MSEYINKQQAIDLIESMIADKGVAFNPHKLAMALKDMEGVEMPEQDTDLISRQAAIELACWRCKKCEKKDCEYKDSCETMSLLEALPSEDPKPPVEPKRPKGEWVRHELWNMPWYTCSECNYHGRNDYKFCPNCGADMRGEE